MAVGEEEEGGREGEEDEEQESCNSDPGVSSRGLKTFQEKGAERQKWKTRDVEEETDKRSISRKISSTTALRPLN